MLISNLYDKVPVISGLNFISGKDIQKTELMSVLGFEKYFTVMNKPFIIVYMRAEKGEYDLTESGIIVDGKTYLPDAQSVTDDKGFAILLYKNSDNEEKHTIKGYIKYDKNSEEIIVESEPVYDVIIKTAN